MCELLLLPACQKVVAVAVALFVLGVELWLVLPRPLYRQPPSAPLYVFLGSSIWSKAEQLSVKMRNTYAQSAHKTTTTKSALSHCHAPLWQPTPITPPTPPPVKRGHGRVTF